ncbi:MAG TPA: 4-(cytidine 5'-diphospho)-2-C-methyl-D-erythritol kinase [Gemmatimonadaceae bacterium]|nr:4-(cytidine 5'-diphospho)-2-C-methyl-D-erythritol kinase [Gemmatimonadaceae bacterium]
MTQDGSLEIAAPAKVNLFLRVLEREPSGFHQIETVFQKLALADTLTVRPTDGRSSLKLSWEGLAPLPLGPVERNLAWRAAAVFQRERDWPRGWDITLVKRIPAGAGLGGGSSDAAAVLRALNALCPDPIDDTTLRTLGAGLGSDVPFFLSDASCAIGRGRGERLTPIGGPPLEPATIALITPGFPIATAEAYGALAAARTAARFPAPRARLTDSTLRSWRDFAAIHANDFEATVFQRYPELEECRNRLERAGASIAMLTGTGSTVFGLWAPGETIDEALVPLPHGRLIMTVTA